VDESGHEAIVRLDMWGRVEKERNKYSILERKSLGKRPAV
jgi:hypothetical protein